MTEPADTFHLYDLNGSLAWLVNDSGLEIPGHLRDAVGELRALIDDAIEEAS